MQILLIATNQAAVISLFRVINRYVGKPNTQYKYYVSVTRRWTLTTDLTLTSAFGTTSTWALGNNGFVITGATGKPFVAASSSLSLPNASLQNSSVTVNTSAPLGGGGAVSLGSTLTFTCASCATFSYPFTLGSNFNSTSTGQIIIASSTIGNGAQNGGITISGGATTTSNAYFAANVGIKAQAPFSKFQIGTATGASTAALSNTASIFTTDVNAGTPSGFAMMLVSKNTAANNVGPTIGFGGESAQGVTPYPYATIRGAKDVAGTYAGYLSFGTTDSSSNIGQERIRITSTGNVGIGTTSPATKLQVSSDASATTTVTIGELGLTSSKACVNMNAADGSASSFYINALHALVVEANYCR